MPSAASFGERWARNNLTRPASEYEIKVLNLFLVTCEGNVAEATKRARRYYRVRSPGGLTELWHRWQPYDEDILCNCQDAHIIPLRTKTVGGRRITIVKIPALDGHLTAKTLLKRWLMILEIRLKEDPTPGEEIVFVDLADLRPSNLKHHFKGSFWKDFVWCMKRAYPLKVCEVHIINTDHLKPISLLLLHVGLLTWKTKVTQIHGTVDKLTHIMGMDYFPMEGLPSEYGGEAGLMKDLNDEWTKKLLTNAKWLQLEVRKFYETELKPELKERVRHKSAMRNIRGRIGSYNVVTRTHSCRSLNSHEDLDDGLYGAYRTIQIASDYGHYK